MKPIVIAGNGPSLKSIDYTRLPSDFDLFRCNQFYFEDKYYLGKKITGVFFGSSLLYEQFFTLKILQQRKEYVIDNFYCRHLYGKGERIRDLRRFENIEDIIRHDFPNIKSTYPYLKKMKDFHELLKFNMIYYGINFNSGISMLITALAQGYSEIYLTGFDFYHKDLYAFCVPSKSKIRQYVHYNTSQTERKIDFDNEIDIQCIRMAKELDNIQLFSLSHETPLNEIIPFAPCQKSKQTEIEDKPQGYIADIITPPFPTRIAKIKRMLSFYGLRESNLIVALVEDLVSLLKSILYYSFTSFFRGKSK